MCGGQAIRGSRFSTGLAFHQEAKSIMSQDGNYAEHCAIINDVRYVIQTRVSQGLDGSRHAEYQVLKDGKVVKPWAEGDIGPLL